MQSNKRTYADRREYHAMRRKSTMDFLRGIRMAGCCTSCGWKEHPEILNFHHRDPSTKRYKLSFGAIGCYSRESVQKEVDKCDLLCPNCHYWLHYQDRSFFDRRKNRTCRVDQK